MNQEKKQIIQCLKKNDENNRIYHDNIPEKYQNDKDIINLEREKGLRKVEKIGFDVIFQKFFVHEFVLDYNEFFQEERWYPEKTEFDDFDSYFDYLNGKIYDNACYYQCELEKINKKIDIMKLKERKSFIDYDINDYNLAPSKDEEFKYNEREKIKNQIKRWVKKFIDCKSAEQLSKTASSYFKSVLNERYGVSIKFFFWQFVFYDIKSKKRFKIIMDYFSNSGYSEDFMIKPLCHVFDVNEILSTYEYSFGSKRTNDKHKRQLRQYIESLNGLDMSKNEKHVYLDNQTHYYCEKDSYGVCRYFETFEELLEYRNYDLTNADLTDDIKLEYDFSLCRLSEKTKLPISCEKNPLYSVKKEYKRNEFEVVQTWYNKNNVAIKQYKHSFEYFFDFVAFLKGDLSGANLIFCDGLKNLLDISNINLSNAEIVSQVCDKFGLKYKKFNLNLDKIGDFSKTKKSETETAYVLENSREMKMSEELSDMSSYLDDKNKERIYYISDLHLMHKLKYARPKSMADVIYVIQNIVDTIVDEAGGTILIAGDVASDYMIYETFLTLLRKKLDKRYREINVIFTLGNHELWNFSRLKLNSIVKKYENLITKCNMYLLHNSIIFKDSEQAWNSILTEELSKVSAEELREKLKTSRVILFGGIGFSGCNKSFNADDGIYRGVLNRSQEIQESAYFKGLYNKVLNAIPDKRLIVLTHMPIECWAEKESYHKGYVYVSGHTHRNSFYDDGEIRVYSDNQLGYKNNKPHLKWFYIDSDYDYFEDYDDGVYQISGKDYQQFYKGKNIMISFNRDINVLYMLKKNGYYCFIHRSKGGSLTILNGGSLKKLDKDDINYYYDNMDIEIAMIKNPLAKYSEVQNKVASEIRKIGGEGYIHGCIVDIDWHSHVYVNPIDLKVTGYWASNIINKIIYSNVASLLDAKCPILYENYKKLLKEPKAELSIITKEESTDVQCLPQNYFDTDIYKASREIKKMQRLYSNILTTWFEIKDSKKRIEMTTGKSKKA